MDSDKEKNKIDITSESFLLEDDDTIFTEEQVQPDSQALLLKQKLKRRKRNIISIIVMIVLSALLFGFALLWQDAHDILAICNALWFVFAMEITMAWVIFVYNKNIFSPIIHAAKTFGLMIVGKKPKQDYYAYMKHVQENQIPAFYYVIIFITAGIIFIPALILMIILM